MKSIIIKGEDKQFLDSRKFGQFIAFLFRLVCFLQVARRRARPTIVRRSRDMNLIIIQ